MNGSKIACLREELAAIYFAMFGIGDREQRPAARPRGNTIGGKIVCARSDVNFVIC